MNLRNNKLRLNVIFGLFQQIISIICGLILPKFILKIYGSETNGLVNSIQSILNVITLMELGVGAVVQSSLYKPLAENDEERVSQILCASNKFFRVVAIIFLVFVLGVTFAYPFYVINSFDYFSTAFLVISISITFFAQYYFGITYSLLLQADQKDYIYNIIQIVSVILNTLGCMLLMINGFSIQIVKFVSSLIFLLRPLLLYFYVKKKYKILKVKLNGNELPQKWNGIYQHIAAYVLENTDILVLTIFATLTDVSIYSVYYLVIHSVRLLVASLSNGIQSYYGNLIAKGQTDLLKNQFNKYSFMFCSAATFIFSVSSIMIVPFVTCYTSGVTDANYHQLAFGILLVLGQFFYCTRLSFNLVILAAGHYKQTQNSAIIEAVINLIISIILVWQFKLIGVAIGTVVAMLYRTIYFAYYCSKNIIKRPISLFVKEMISYLTIFLCASGISIYVNLNYTITNFLYWVLAACILSCLVAVIFILVNLILNFKRVKATLLSFKKK